MKRIKPNFIASGFKVNARHVTLARLFGSIDFPFYCKRMIVGQINWHNTALSLVKPRPKS